MKNILKTISALLIVISSLLLLNPAFAQVVDFRETLNTELDKSANETYDIPAKEGSEAVLLDQVANVANIVLGILGLLAVILIIYAGFLWMMADGSNDKITVAKKILTRVVIGIVVISLAYAIVAFVVARVSVPN